MDDDLIGDPSTLAKKVDEVTKNFAEDIVSKVKSCEKTTTTLKTDQKVLARITDGIYRHASSALRELICNSYDADATEVYIDTDAPRFKKITVRDNGNGMSAEVLSNMLHHIGGSAKRNFKQSHLKIFAEEDPTLSPIRKRKLIGKIGIGLFSVAQLTREFSIITKQRDCDYYLIADIKLHNYSEEEVQKIEKRGESFETGSVEVYTKKADDSASQGTDIILKNIKKSAIDQLRSVEIWHQTLGDDEEFVGQDAKPDYHIGAVNEAEDSIISEAAKLPWKKKQKPEDKFISLYNNLVSLESTNKHPSLSKNLDNYIRMLWMLGLSLPVDYIDKSPYELGLNDSSHINLIRNNEKTAKKLDDFDGSSSVGAFLKLEANMRSDEFNVLIDGVKIFRPIKPIEPVKTSAAFNKPILFFGKVSPNLSGVDKVSSGGNLKFEAFIKWSPRIIPKEHRGVVIRIHGASGVAFDPDFMRWQLAEHYIKTQLTVEINILEGFESALNIDRESFNIAHPHYQITMRWLHHALKQVVYAVKAEKAKARDVGQKDRAQKREEDLSSIVSSVNNPSRDSDESPASIKIIDETETVNVDDNFSYKMQSDSFKKALSKPNLGKEKQDEIEKKLNALVEILDKFEVLDSLSKAQRGALFEALTKVLSYEN